MTVLITLSSVGSDAGPSFNLYSSPDGTTFASVIDGINKTDLEAGYEATVPDGTTIIRVTSASPCANYEDLTITDGTTPPTFAFQGAIAVDNYPQNPGVRITGVSVDSYPISPDYSDQPDSGFANFPLFALETLNGAYDASPIAGLSTVVVTVLGLVNDTGVTLTWGYPYPGTYQTTCVFGTGTFTFTNLNLEEGGAGGGAEIQITLLSEGDSCPET